MFAKVAVIIMSCIGSMSFADYNPHILNASLSFVQRHPQQCSMSAPLVLDWDVSIEQCQSRAEIHFMPGWLQDPANKGRVWLGAKCERHEAQDIIMGPIEERAEH